MNKFISFEKSELIFGESHTIEIPSIESWLALYNCNVYWVIPTSGMAAGDIPDHTQYLLWKTADGGYGLILPLICGDIKASLCGAENGVTVKFQGALKGAEPDGAELLYIAYGDDPYKLTEESMRAVSERLGSFKLRKEKHIPEFIDYLGWCTWDAFYGSVDEEKVIMGLESFKNASFPLGFMILDDGSWDAYYDNLNEIRVKPEKFSNGLHVLIENAKKNYGIKIFGVWHCFEGYWGGINPEGALAERYTLIKNRANIRPWEKEEKIQDIYFISPDEADRFYSEFHSYLYSEGADMLKIDGQSAMDIFTVGKIGQGSAMKKYQQAMQKYAEKYFGSRVIHCMSNSIDVAYNMDSTNCWRNSYDYAPKDLKMQQEHIYINAMNAMWTSTFSVPDWDMFQSHSAGAEIHAAARAICGGPIYVCDYPGKQNFDILNKLITSDGKTLKCDSTALPSKDCLFTDFYNEKKLLKIFNSCEDIGVLGIFNCNSSDGKITDKYSASDIENLKGEKFAVYINRTGKLFTADRTDILTASIAKDEYELVSFSPIINGAAPIGLIDKYNNAASVSDFRFKDERFRAVLKDGGKTGFYCSHKPSEVKCNGENTEFTYDEKSGMLIVLSDKKGVNMIEIVM